ncbi:Ig-like domain-containing protein [Massilia sp. S19_KUP03_FR1]|uniref:Ig-like domain-containing protein n=1 Tax=Massilia sp. S19_KUP03_FR1 TaxID=3025503 RepID=UPI002FCDB151
MKNQSRDFKTTRLRLSALALASTLALVACGGGGGSPGGTAAVGSGTTTPATGTGTGTTVPVTTPTLTVALTNAAGSGSNSLTGATPLTARATVLDKDGKAVVGAIVAFATDATLGLFTPTAGTSLTDASGVASMTLRSASLSAAGAGKLTATATVAGTTVSSDTNYTVGSTALTFGPVTSTLASIQAYGSTTLSVDVIANGAKYTDQSVNVNFSSACVTAGKATLAATVATIQGTAQVVYRDKGCGNNDTISVGANGVTKAATTTLTIAPPAAASVQFTTASPVGKSIVIAGQGGIGRTETATLTFTVSDIFGNPLSGQPVVFTPSTNLVKLNKTTDTTDALGQVITTVNSLSTPTSFSIFATLPGKNIFTQSDSIVVTTGRPDQAHMSMSATVYNTDGWNYDSGTTVPASMVNLLLADSAGNPVPDGTPIVFQTNLGAVGSSNQGACTTLNGGCSVDFRTQSPRVASPGLPATPCNTGTGAKADSTRPGLATVCASTTDGTNTLFTRIGIFFSGNTAASGILNGSIPLTSGISTPYDLGTITQTGSKVFTIQFNDVNGNPMPIGSSVALTSVAGVTASAPSPDVVPNVAPHSSVGDDISGVIVSGNQGSTHTFTVAGIQKTDGCQTVNASFVAAITSAPGTTRAVTTTFPFKLTVTCF